VDFPFEGAIVHSAEARDQIPVFFDVLRTITPDAADDLVRRCPDVTGETTATHTYDRWCRWCETAAAADALTALIAALRHAAPAGYWFGSHPRAANEFGFWPDDER